MKKGTSQYTRCVLEMFN